MSLCSQVDEALPMNISNNHTLKLEASKFPFSYVSGYKSDVRSNHVICAEECTHYEDLDDQSWGTFANRGV